MTKTALITGINGQDGAYLAKHLINKGYEVHGLARRNSDNWRLHELAVNPNIVYGDVTENVGDIIRDIRPDEVYNLAAQSHVGFSFDHPKLTTEVDYYGALNVIEAVKGTKTRVYQASTSELFGYNNGGALSEKTPFAPRSPYAIAKLAAHWAGVNARQEDVFVSNGILFNHESPLRGIDFVTRKITNGVARIAAGHDHIIELGNLDAMRDWGHAADYVEAMHLVLQHNKPDDFVIGTGKAHSVCEFLELAFKYAGIDYLMEGKGKDEVWYDRKGKVLMRINPEFYRPNDVNCLIANPRKAREVLDWKRNVGFRQLVHDMVNADMRRYGVKNEQAA